MSYNHNIRAEDTPPHSQLPVHTHPQQRAPQPHLHLHRFVQDEVPPLNPDADPEPDPEPDPYEMGVMGMNLGPDDMDIMDLNLDPDEDPDPDLDPTEYDFLDDTETPLLPQPSSSSEFSSNTTSTNSSSLAPLPPSPPSEGPPSVPYTPSVSPPASPSDMPNMYDFDPSSSPLSPPSQNSINNDNDNNNTPVPSSGWVLFGLVVLAAVACWRGVVRCRAKREQRLYGLRSAQADRVLGDMQMVPNEDLDLQLQLQHSDTTSHDNELL